MAHAFQTISAKPTFGTIRENLNQSDYLNRKKGILTFCNASSTCPRLINNFSYDSKYTYNLGRNSITLNQCNNIPINKSNLIIGQYSKENLKDICTVQKIDPSVSPKPCGLTLPCNPCQINSPVVINPSSTNPFYFTYQIDPLGQLFGKSQCGELNYTQYFVLNPPQLTNSTDPSLSEENYLLYTEENYLLYTFNCSYPQFTKETIASYIPIITIPGTFEIEPIITINNTFVRVYIKIIYININSNQDFGITFNQLGFTDFYNDYTTNLSFVGSSNCPLSRNGYQFSTLQGNFQFNPYFKPLILPNTSLFACFYYCNNFNQPIGNWNVSNVNNMGVMFEAATDFNQPIGTWDVSNVNNMYGMFEAAIVFNQDISSWDVSKVTNMQSMFQSAFAFNQPIGNWDVSKVILMFGMFQSASAFNQNIGGWDVSNVNNMAQMFQEASIFNQPIGSWNVSNVTNMQSMFQSACAFNQSIGCWDVSNVTNMASMFQSACSFNQSVACWDVSNVTTMVSMFQTACAFNQPIGSWNVSNVTNMSSMFQSASSFNQPIGTWDVSNVTNMSSMFQSTSSFNYNISNWNVLKVTNMSSMFNGASLFNNGNNQRLLWSINLTIYNLTQSGGVPLFNNPPCSLTNSNTEALYNYAPIPIICLLGNNNP